MTVAGDRIAAFDESPGAGVAEIDLQGAIVVPAFCDAHVHLDGTGMRAGAFDLSGARSAADFARAVERLPRSPRLFAGGYDDALWPDGRADAQALEAAHPDAVALLVRVDGHSSIVNRKTLAWLDLPPHTEGIERDALGGATGRLTLDANWRAQSAFFEGLPERERRGATRRACDAALAAGVVYLHAQLLGLGSDETYADEVRFLLSLPGVRIRPKICERRPSLAAALGLAHIGGDVFLDGSLGSRTAALCEPYRDSPGVGDLALSDSDVFAYFDEAERLGISAGVHAIGDRAIGQAVRAIELAQGGAPSLRTRHFIEHAELASDEHVAACARLGIAFSMQPQFDAAWGGDDGMYGERLGAERAARLNRLRTVAASGVLLACGSDSPVCRLSALDGMGAAVAHHVPEERLSPLEALTAYTYSGARLTSRQPSTGALAPGFDAAFTVLDHDPFGGAAFAQTRVLQTWSGGRCVYGGNRLRGNFVS